MIGKPNAKRLDILKHGSHPTPTFLSQARAKRRSVSRFKMTLPALAFSRHLMGGAFVS
jgi:hypothetical protein